MTLINSTKLLKDVVEVIQISNRLINISRVGDIIISRNLEVSKAENEWFLEDRNRHFPEGISPPLYVHSTVENPLIIADKDYKAEFILRGANAQYVSIYLNVTTCGKSAFDEQLKKQARYDRGFLGNKFHLRDYFGFKNWCISKRDLEHIVIPILPIDDLGFASKKKLESLPIEELMKIEENYTSLNRSYHKKRLLKLEKDKIAAEKDFVIKKSRRSKIKKSKRRAAHFSDKAHEEQLSELYRMLTEILNNQKLMSSKLDKIQSILSELATDFNSIKSLPRKIDEKISRLSSSLDRKLEDLITDKKELEVYISEIKNWFDYYHLLETKSQQYIPEAEYIFDQISRLENPDYSPYILQYCRALENELLKKIFRSYVQSLIDRKITLTEYFKWDYDSKVSGKLNSENSYKLVLHLNKCVKKPENEWFFEMGSMEFNLRFLTGDTADKSPLLIDLKQFVLSKFQKEILSIKYLDEIKIITLDFRNQSAHPNLIDVEKAERFRELIKVCLIDLMTNYKHN